MHGYDFLSFLLLCFLLHRRRHLSRILINNRVIIIHKSDIVCYCACILLFYPPKIFDVRCLPETPEIMLWSIHFAHFFLFCFFYCNLRFSMFCAHLLCTSQHCMKVYKHSCFFFFLLCDIVELHSSINRYTIQWIIMRDFHFVTLMCAVYTHHLSTSSYNNECAPLLMVSEADVIVLVCISGGEYIFANFCRDFLIRRPKHNLLCIVHEILRIKKLRQRWQVLR